MKKFLSFAAVAFVMAAVTSCAGSTKNEEDTATMDTIAVEDTTVTDSTDVEDTAVAAEVPEAEAAESEGEQPVK